MANFCEAKIYVMTATEKFKKLCESTERKRWFFMNIIGIVSIFWLIYFIIVLTSFLSIVIFTIFAGAYLSDVSCKKHSGNYVKFLGGYMRTPGFISRKLGNKIVVFEPGDELKGQNLLCIVKVTVGKIKKKESLAPHFYIIEYDTHFEKEKLELQYMAYMNPAYNCSLSKRLGQEVLIEAILYTSKKDGIKKLMVNKILE
jgi:hypothetical protein